MTLTTRLRRAGALALIAAVVPGCAYQGLNSLPLPGAVGRDGSAYHVQIANIGSLEPNSPVMINDVVVGSVGATEVVNWNADVEIFVRRDVVIPANAVARVGQTSLLGSMHLALDPPVGQPPQGRLSPGSTIVLDRSSTYPSTERTLSSLAAVVNSGGLGQIGDIIHTMNTALGGREQQARELLQRLDAFVATFERQKTDVVAAIESMNRLSKQLADQRDIVARTLQDLPPALDVLLDDQPQLMTALDRAREFSDLTTRLVRQTSSDLVGNLTHLAPALKALADVGPEIATALAYITVIPYGQNVVDRGVRGDYMNLYIVLDLTVNRLKRTLLSGTRFGDGHVPLVPVPGDPGYDAFYNPTTTDPLRAPLQPPPAGTSPGETPAAPAPDSTTPGG
ncbi:MCE family protein [Mycobacterium sp. 236(2023)]|uniref:MCE family protein n=1 Tax=Mycobacterium sp. 236(2023) TaxID=3038163 RepID=UPI002415489D|nr:MCE family protein [Mycobacterium sp. 236(2023)]MDG4669265.1 MCE family protein [Mycobacterium sp. 236(2023)]